MKIIFKYISTPNLINDSSNAQQNNSLSSGVFIFNSQLKIIELISIKILFISNPFIISFNFSVDFNKHFTDKLLIELFSSSIVLYLSLSKL